MIFNEVISLGNSCCCKGFIRDMGWSNNSYPFDWLLVDKIENVNNIIKNDFYMFFEVMSIQRKVYDKSCFHINDLTYKVASIHDVNNNGLYDLPLEDIVKTKEFIMFKDKMYRRIDRWNNMLRNNDVKILFLTMDMYKLSTIEGIKESFELIKSKHENMEYHHLFNVNFRDVVENYHIEGVKKIPITSCDWGKWKTDPLFQSYANATQS